MPQPQVKRNAKRADVLMPTRLCHGGLQSVQVTIRDLSFGGFRAECATTFMPGQFVSIELPSIGLVRSKVAWCRDGQIGCTFNRAVDVRRCVLQP